MTYSVTNAAHIVLFFFSLLCLSPPSHDCFLPPKYPSFLISLCIFCSLIMFPHFSYTYTPISHHSVFPSQSSHLLYQHPCTHTFLFPSSIILLLPVFLDSCSTFPCFLHTYPSHLLSLIPAFVCLRLHVLSQVDWPLNIIITDSCMNKYNRLFSFLLQLKHMVWSLRDVWFHLKRTGEKRWELLIQVQQSPPYF